MQKSFYVFSSGALKRKDNTIFLEMESGKRFIPVEDTSELHVFGEVDVTKKFLELASQKEITIHFYNYYGYYSGSFYPREHRNSGYMILRQAEHYMDEKKRLILAQAFVRGALKNIRVVARYYASRGEEDLEQLIQTLDERLLQVNETESITELMAIEGGCREAYYGYWDAIVKQSDFAFGRRSRRPPENRLNAVISFCNTLLYTAALSQIYRTHLDPRIGFLHATNFRRFTLNLDVAEIFKPIMVDRTIFTLIGRKQLSKEHFATEAGGVFLTEQGRQRVVQEFEERLKATISHRKLGRSVSYRGLVRMELFKLQKHLMGEEEYEPYHTRW
ncbi:MAG: type I-B CRISPR-associated endonuclease Cas1b [Limnochordia bacterium]|jgi:CRISPR-associated protein Cas1